MEEIEKTLKMHTWNEASMIRILLDRNNKSILKEFLPLFRRYTDTIIINYQEGLAARAMVSIGSKTIALA